MSEVPLIRILMPDDAEAYRTVRLAGIADRPQSFGSSFEEEAARPVSDFEARILAPRPDAIFGAFLPSGLVGIIRFHVDKGIRRCHVGYLTGVTVRREARKQGVGARLLDAVLDHARSSVIVIRLSVESGNAEARRLYERAGFRCYGTEPRSVRVGDAFFDEDLMSLNLDAGAPGHPKLVHRHA